VGRVHKGRLVVPEDEVRVVRRPDLQPAQPQEINPFFSQFERRSLRLRLTGCFAEKGTS
jgi:hypothetical protein